MSDLILNIMQHLIFDIVPSFKLIQTYAIRNIFLYILIRIMMPLITVGQMRMSDIF